MVRGLANVNLLIDSERQVWLCSTGPGPAIAPKRTVLMGFGTGTWVASDPDENGLGLLVSLSFTCYLHEEG